MATPNSLIIDPRAYQQARLALKQFHLDAKYPRLAKEFEELNLARPESLDLKTFAAAKAELDRHLARLEQTPFPPAATGVLDVGPITAGYEVWDGTRIGLSPTELTRHVLIPGMT